jgi:hypothetical protein
MFKLTLLLSAAIFLVLLIGGEDRGQLRPGLVAASLLPAEPAVAVPAAPAQADPAPADLAAADIAPATAPVVVSDAAQPALAPQPDAALPATEAEVAVFSLATFADPPPPADDAPAAEPADTTLAQAVEDTVADTVADAGSAGPVAIVDAQSVNVRSGPGTDFVVLTRLQRGEEVIRIGDAGNGWALVRIEGDGVEGYVSTRYLSAP